MLGKNIAIRGIFTTILLITLCFSQVSLEIANVDTTAGTLDIYMSNAAACSYCPDSTYNNYTQDWVEQKEDCEDFGDTTWVSYDSSLDSVACAAVPSFDGNGGWWFDGNVGGFQLQILGATVTGASGGSASDAGFTVSTTENDPITTGTNGIPNVLAFSLTGATIPVGSNVLLTKITFTDFDNSDICFGVDTSGTAGNNIISDASAGYIAADWGGCYCGSASQNDADGDSICNDDDNCPNGATDAGTGEDDQSDTDEDGVGDACDACAETPSGTTNVDEITGCTPDQLSISQVGSYLPNEFAISQNFPNPFNPVTSITFDVAEMDEVFLVVYDLIGKEVATLVSGTYAPGTYNVEWNAVNNAGDGIVSGMYIYRYISSEKAITRKMLYLK